MTPNEAKTLARELLAGKTRSYVQDAQRLSQFLLEQPDVKWEVQKGIDGSHGVSITVDDQLVHRCQHGVMADVVEPQDVVGSTPTDVSTVAGFNSPQGEWGVDPADNGGNPVGNSRKSVHSKPAFKPGSSEHVTFWQAVHEYGHIVYGTGVRPDYQAQKKQAVVVEERLTAIVEADRGKELSCEHPIEHRRAFTTSELWCGVCGAAWFCDNPNAMGPGKWHQVAQRRSEAQPRSIMVGGYAPGNETPNNREVKLGAGAPVSSAWQAYQSASRGAGPVAGGVGHADRHDTRVGGEHRAGHPAPDAALDSDGGQGVAVDASQAPRVVEDYTRVERLLVAYGPPRSAGTTLALAIENLLREVRHEERQRSAAATVDRCSDCDGEAGEAHVCSPAMKVKHGAAAQPSELFPLAVRIEKGRQKYPNGCTLLSLLDERGEVAHAVNKYESEDRVRDELLDVAAVAMRLYLGEIDRGLELDGLVQRRAVDTGCTAGDGCAIPCRHCGAPPGVTCADHRRAAAKTSKEST